jgi:hypothetical protein
MFVQQCLDIHLPLPTTNYKPAGEHVILETAESKIDFTTYPGTSDRLVIVLLDQDIVPSRVQGIHAGLIP